MDYHIFRKPKIVNGKTVHRWYYYYIDPVTGKKVQKSCGKCKNQAEAYAFISNLSPLFESSKKIKIADIAKWMFIPGGDHLNRLEKLGRVLDIKTIKNKRHILEIIVENFGNLELKDLKIPMVIEFLSDDEDHSGSWKNNFLTVLNDLYEEAPFCGVENISAPKFPKFRRNTIKKDIFTTEELNRLFSEELWSKLNSLMYEKCPQYNEGYKDIYLMFLCCSMCGLRIGEAIALRKKQFMFDQNMLLVDGFFKHDSKERTNFNKCGSADNQKIRVVPLPENLVGAMKEYIASREIGPEDYVFTRYNLPLRKHLVEKWFGRAMELAGIETEGRKLTPHSLRFTYITRMRRNCDGEIVQKLAGHNSMEMTEYYTRAAIPEMVEAAKHAMEAANKLFA